jgi:hypothetical protein
MSLLYTNDQITQFADRQGCTVEKFKERWIIVNNGSCFIHGPSGYRAPVKNTLDLAMSLKKHLAPVPPSKDSPAGIDWEISIGAGSKEKTTERIITEYGSLATKHIMRTDIANSYYDAPNETFYEHVCQLRKLEPIFDPQVDHWMRLLGGKYPETLLDWVATCPDLTRPSPAIYLHAGKDTGKNMFADGIARLWGQSSTPLSSAIGDFNSAVIDCPLVFADEEIPKGVTSGWIRDFVGSLNRQIKRKNIAEAKLLGAIRLVIAANNPNILKFDREDFSVEDIAAIAARILYFECSPEAAKFLKKLGGFEGTTDWVYQDRIAKHAMWLHHNRSVKRGPRFLVEGGIDIVHRNLATNGAARDRTVEWVCRAMLEKWSEQNPGIRFGGGELYVNASFVQQKWESMLGEQRIPSLKKIGQAFKPLAIGERRLPIGSDRVNGRNRRVDFYRLDPQFVYDSASSLQIGTEEDFRALINRPVLIDDEGDSGNGSGSPEMPITIVHGPSNGFSHTNVLAFNPFNSENPAAPSLFDRLTIDPK